MLATVAFFRSHIVFEKFLTFVYALFTSDDDRTNADEENETLRNFKKRDRETVKTSRSLFSGLTFLLIQIWKV